MCALLLWRWSNISPIAVPVFSIRWRFARTSDIEGESSEKVAAAAGAGDAAEQRFNMIHTAFTPAHAAEMIAMFDGFETSEWPAM